MYSVSNQFKSKILEPSRLIASRITLGSTVIDGTYIQGITWNDSICTGDDFEIGTAVMADVTIELIDIDFSLRAIEFENKEIYAEIGIEISTDAFEYVPLGYFTIEEVNRKDRAISLKAVDRMYKFEKEYISALTYPVSLKNIADEICSLAGVTLVNDIFINSEKVVNNKPVLEGISLRKAIAQIAELAGGYARINRNGELEIFNIDTGTQASTSYAGNDFYTEDIKAISDELIAGEIAVTRDNYIDFSSNDLKMASIDKVVVKLGAEQAYQGEGDNPLYIVDNIFCQNPNLFVDGLYEVLNGTTYMPYSSKWQGNPAIDCGDLITINIGLGLYYTIVTNRTLTYRGGLRETYKAVAKSNTEKNSTGKGSMTIEMKNQKSEIIVMKDQITQVVTETNALEGRIDTAETQISQNAQQIILKASQSSVDALGNRVTDAESSITQQANQIALKVNTSDFSSLIEQNPSSVKIAVGQIGGNNLFKDGSFENGHNIKSENHACTFGDVSVVTEYGYLKPYEGDKFMLAIGTGVTYSYVDFYQHIPVKPGKKYTISFWLAMDTNATSFTRDLCGVIFYDSNGTYLTDIRFTNIVHMGYNKYTFFAPEGASTINVRFGLTITSTPTSTYVAVDAVKVEEGENATAFSPHPSELKGTNYTFDSESFKIGNDNSVAEHTPEYSKWVHSDGSYTKAGIDGFERWIAASGNRYRSMVYIGEGGADFAAGEGDKQVTLQLPAEFRGKNFDVVVSPTNLIIGTSNIRLERFRASIVNTAASQVDRVNGIIKPYVGLSVRNSSGSFITGTLVFSYIVVA